MLRRPRFAAGDLTYHVLNRHVGRLPLFEKSADYVTFVAKRWGHYEMGRLSGLGESNEIKQLHETDRLHPPEMTGRISI